MNFDLAQPQATERAGLTNAFARPHLDVLLSAVLAISGARPSAARSRFALVGLTYAPWRLARSAMADTGVAYLSAEDRARVEIDRMLAAAGWVVQCGRDANLAAARGVAVREFVLEKPHGRADYLLFVDGQAVGVIEAKKEGETLTGVEWQTAKYVDGLPDDVPSARSRGRCRSSTSRPATETRFTNGLDPEPAAATSSAFHRPETLAGWLDECAREPAAATTLRHRLRTCRRSTSRPLAGAGARDPQPRALARREPAARADPDGDRVGQDLHGRQPRLPAGQARRRATASSSSSTAPTSAGRR